MTDPSPDARPSTIVVTGASGNVGLPVIEALAEAPEAARVRAATRSGSDELEADEQVAFDFADPTTYATAFRDIDSLFLMRPNAVSDVEEVIFPAVDAAVDAGVGHIVTLSVQGADKNPLLPHRRLEKYVEESGVPYTHLRPGFFMQNLTTVHRPGIRDDDEIYVPSKGGAANFVDTRDIGEAAARILLEGKPHFGKAYDLTGARTYNYDQVADILTDVLGRDITYDRPGYIRYIRHMLDAGYELGLVLFSCLPHTIVRLGLAERLTDDLPQLLDRPPRSLEEFARDHQHLWESS